MPQVYLGHRQRRHVFLLLRRSKQGRGLQEGDYGGRRTTRLAALHAVLADDVATYHVTSSSTMSFRDSEDKTVACW